VPFEIALKYADVVAQNPTIAHLELCRAEYFSEWCRHVKGITDESTITYHWLCRKTGIFNEWYSARVRPLFEAAAEYQVASSGKK
jgi:hypothetical protein